MQILGVLFKIVLLLFGAALLLGGGLAGLCGVIEGSGELFLAGFVPGMLGLMLFIWVVGSLKKKSAEPKQSAAKVEQDQP